VKYETQTSKDRKGDFCNCKGKQYGQNENNSCGHIEIERALRGWDFDLELAVRYLIRKDRKVT
jgi:hypothetical protein